MRGSIILVVWLLLMVLPAVARAQDNEALRREVEQLRRQQEQYQKTIEALNERLKRLELQNAPAAAQPAPPATPPTAGTPRAPGAPAAAAPSAPPGATPVAQVPGGPAGELAVGARAAQSPPAVLSLSAARRRPAPVRHGRHRRLRRQPHAAQRAEGAGRHLLGSRESLLSPRGRAEPVRSDRSLRARRRAHRGRRGGARAGHGREPGRGDDHAAGAAVGHAGQARADA